MRSLVAVTLAVGQSCHQAASTAVLQTSAAPVAPVTESDSDAGVVGLRCGSGTVQVGAQCLALSCGPGTVQVGNECLVGEPPPPDPLLGSWLAPPQPSAGMGACDFFPDGIWNKDCISLSGLSAGWERIADNKYVLKSTFQNCLAETTFSGDRNSVSIQLRCNSWQAPSTQTVNLVRWNG